MTKGKWKYEVEILAIALGAATILKGIQRQAKETIKKIEGK